MLSDLVTAQNVLSLFALVLSLTAFFYVLKANARPCRCTMQIASAQYPTSMRSPLDEIIRRPLRRCEEEVFLLDELENDLSEGDLFDMTEITKVEPRGIETVTPPVRQLAPYRCGKNA